jgi:choline transporter-like protein 2/4/5
MAIDTLFLCFLQDSEINDGSKEKPFYMSKKLMKILGKKNVCDEEKK